MQSVVYSLVRFASPPKVWELPKENPDRFREVMGQLAIIVATIGHMVRPFMPATAESIFTQLGIDPDSQDEWEFTLKKGESLFPRHD